MEKLKSLIYSLKRNRRNKLIFMAMIVLTTIMLFRVSYMELLPTLKTLLTVFLLSNIYSEFYILLVLYNTIRSKTNDNNTPD
jgi:uncharacterized membrane protein YGL010W